MGENTIRSISGSIYIALLVSSILFSENSFLVLFGVLLIIAIYEFCNLINLNKVLAISIGLGFYIAFIFLKLTLSIKIMLLIATIFESIKLILLLFQNRKIQLDFLSKLNYLIGYLILPIIILTKISISNYTSLYQPRIIIGVFILIWTNDTFAYLVGKSIGKRKLFESISPKKTIEGFVGGLIFSIFAGIIVALFFMPKPLYFWIIIAIIVSVFGTIGDLIESKFKRMAGVKDSGKIMPGHGGVLDRLDSVIFVAPFIYLFLQILQFITYA